MHPRSFKHILRPVHWSISSFSSLSRLVVCRQRVGYVVPLSRLVPLLVVASFLRLFCTLPLVCSVVAPFLGLSSAFSPSRLSLSLSRRPFGWFVPSFPASLSLLVGVFVPLFPVLNLETSSLVHFRSLVLSSLCLVSSFLARGGLDILNTLGRSPRW